ncbi:unnamed protein product [Rhizophagus irregularis]|nr:unnamed protein product [Rhizophagus irregularis]
MLCQIRKTYSFNLEYLEYSTRIVFQSESESKIRKSPIKKLGSQTNNRTAIDTKYKQVLSNEGPNPSGCERFKT